MPIYQITPLAPAYLLLLGAVLILALGPALTSRRRHGLAVAISALAALSLFFVGSGYPADVNLVHTLVEWLGIPALALRVPSFEPFLWALMLSLLAISLAEGDVIGRLSSLDQAMLFALAAVACGVVLAGTFRTLAFALLLFDGTAALFLLSGQRPSQAGSGEHPGPPRPVGQGTGSRAVGRLLLGVLSSAVVIVLAQGTDYLTAHPHDLGALFSLTLWLRLGLYPLAESNASPGSLPPMRLGWTIVNLAVGLYLVSANVVPWLAWLAGATTVLHGALAWLELDRERALAHAGHALAGGTLTMAAVVGGGPGIIAASLSTLAALVTLGLTPPRLGRPQATHPQRLWAYLPPLLATASLIGVPFTLGWEGRGALYQATWEAGAPGALALVVVAEGAALSALYHYWRRLLPSAPAEAEHPAGPDTAREGNEVPQGGREQSENEVWRPLGATLASIPFLIPVLGPHLLPVVAPSASSHGLPLLSTSLGGRLGSLLWAFFLGYGRRRLLDAMPFSHHALMSILRLGWLLRGLGHTLDTIGRVLLRVRAVFEGEHYLAWAILLALGLVLVILLR